MGAHNQYVPNHTELQVRTHTHTVIIKFSNKIPRTDTTSLSLTGVHVKLTHGDILNTYTHTSVLAAAVGVG